MVDFFQSGALLFQLSIYVEAARSPLRAGPIARAKYVIASAAG